MKPMKAMLSIVLLGLALNLSVSAVDVVSNVGAAFPVGSTVTFMALNTSNTTPATTYTWDFGDGSTVVTLVPMANHVYTMADDLLIVDVIVHNGIDPDDENSDFFEAFNAPPPGDPIGVNAKDPPVTNPDDGVSFSFTLDPVRDGFISAVLSDTGNPGGGPVTIVTSFGDAPPGSGTRKGAILQHRYTAPGIFILDSQFFQAGSQTGQLRKTLAFSEKDILGSYTDPNIVDLPVDSRQLVFKSIKGKFNFKGNAPKDSHAAVTPDTVTISWTMMLPAGFNPSTQNAQISIGNVMDTVTLKSNGTGIVNPGSPFKTVSFKFPRLKKGQTFPATPFSSIVTVSMSSANLPAQGFDTEGITNRAFKTTNTKGPFARSIQVASVFGGVTYAGLANVNLTVTSGGDFGNIVGRR